VTEDPRYPAIHILRETTDEQGRRISEPVTSPVCDFCSDKGPAWDYDCLDFMIPPDHASAGGWAACTPCSDLIEADDYEGLYERALKFLEFMPPAMAEAMRPRIRVMHGGFRKFRYGDRRPWG
jgi:hypothetical protein